MRSLLFIIIILSLALPLFAQAACLKTEKDFAIDGPKLLIKFAQTKKYPGITDFSKKIGSKSSSGVASVNAGPEKLWLVQTNLGTQQVLNGVFRCDQETGKMKLIAISWVSPKGSGVGGGD